MKNGRYKEYGQIRWYKDDMLHREDGPAIVYPNGTKKWFIHGKRHRVNDPAIEYSYGGKAWWVEGKLHRLDGPAWEGADGSKVWCVDGQEVDITAIFCYEPSVPLSDEEQLILRLST